MIKVESLFREIHDQVDQRKAKFQEEVLNKIKQMEDVCVKHSNDLIQNVVGKADLWSMSTKSKLNYFSE